MNVRKSLIVGGLLLLHPITSPMRASGQLSMRGPASVGPIQFAVNTIRETISNYESQGTTSVDFMDPNLSNTLQPRISEKTKAKNLKKTKGGDIELDCSATPTSALVQPDNFKIRGVVCGENLKIVNRNNGFQASIFERGAKFTTDVIQLSPGPNEIEFSYTDTHQRQRSKRLMLTK